MLHKDVLDIYQRPYDPECPVVCMNASNKQLSIGVRPPIFAGPCQVRCEDGEWKRNGVADVFIFVEPQHGSWLNIAECEPSVLCR